LLKRFRNCKVIVNHPLWYSPNTQNGATYLAEGLARLQTYFPEIELLVKNYSKTNIGHVFVGDIQAFNYFKENYTDALQHEQGRQGIFYLHPNQKGAARLACYWVEYFVLAGSHIVDTAISGIQFMVLSEKPVKKKVQDIMEI
jgi:hypothetical protein